MRKAGGIIGIIAGIFGVIAAIATLLIGGIGAAVEAQEANLVVSLGWGGVIFSFLTIIFGAIVTGAQSRWPGVLLSVSAIMGAVLGGTFVAVFMVLGFVGGLLAIFGQKKIAPVTA